MSKDTDVLYAQLDCCKYDDCLQDEALYSAGFRYDSVINGWIK